MKLLRDLTDQYLQNPIGDKVRSIMDFAALKTLACPGELSLDELVDQSTIDLNPVFNHGDVHIQWERATLTLRKLLKIDQVPGDIRALYYLIASRKPQSVIVIGVPDGDPATAIALALKDYAPDATLTILNTSDDECSSLTRKQIAAAGLDDVSVLNARGPEFFDGSDLTFDVVYCHDDQPARDLYLTTHGAIAHLNPGGLVIYAGYYPDAKPVYTDQRFMSAAYMTLARLCAETPRLAVLPIGSLPWPTQQGSTLSTLALLARDSGEAASA